MELARPVLKRTFLLLAAFCGYAHAQSLDYPSVWQCDANKPNWYCDLDESQPRIPPSPVPPQRLELKDIETAKQLRKASTEASGRRGGDASHRPEHERLLGAVAGGSEQRGGLL